MRERHIYNGVELNPPNNYEAIGYELRYDQSGNANSESTVDVEIGIGENGDAFEVAKNWMADKITQGLPYRVEVSDELGNEFTIFDGYLNLWAAKINEQNKRIEARAVETKGLAWLAENGDAVTFDYLFQKGFIKQSDFVNIPYVINRVGRNSETFLAVLSGFVITNEIRKIIIKEIPECLGRVGGFFTTPAAAVEVIALFAYLLFLFISLAAILLEFMNLVINPVKYHKGMRVLDLVRSGCDFFGLKLSSSILESATFRNMVILPEKYVLYQSPARRFLGKIRTSEGTENGYYRGTFGQLIEALRQMFYAKVIIKDGTLYFERDNFRLGTPAFKIPAIAGEFQTYQRNFDEFYSTFVLEFIADGDDRNVIQNYKGTSVQVNTTPNLISDQRNNLARRIERVSVPFALARRKSTLNFIETVANGFLLGLQTLINGLIAVANGLIAVANAAIAAINVVISTINFLFGTKLKKVHRIDGRIEGIKIDIVNQRRNFLVMEEDFVNVPKIMLLNDDGKLNAQNEQVLNARYLFENYHYLRNFQLGNNQWKTLEMPRVQLSYSEVAALRETNYCETADGQEAEIISFKLNPALQITEGSYRVRERYISNLNVEIIEPD